MFDAVDLEAQVFHALGRLRLTLAAAEQGLQLVKQNLIAERLGHVQIGPARIAEDHVHLVGLVRHHDHGHIPGAFAGPEFLADRQAVNAREHDIEQDDVRQQHLGLAQPLGAVLGDEGFVPLAAEVPAQRLYEAALVFDDQDAGLGHHTLQWGGRSLRWN